LKRWTREGSYLDVLKVGSLLATVQMLEKKYEERFARVLGPTPKPQQQRSQDALLAQFHMTPRHTGESMDNLLKIFHLLDRHPDLALFVQTNPAFCCPGLVTEAMAAQIERVTGVPMVSITYDGTSSPKNDLVAPYLRYARTRRRPRPVEQPAP
jgi:hypothetical protein